MLTTLCNFHQYFGYFRTVFWWTLAKKHEKKTRGNGLGMKLESRETNEKRQNENWGNKNTQSMKYLALTKQEQWLRRFGHVQRMPTTRLPMIRMSKLREIVVIKGDQEGHGWKKTRWGSACLRWRCRSMQGLTNRWRHYKL